MYSILNEQNNTLWFSLISDHINQKIDEPFNKPPWHDMNTLNLCDVFFYYD